MPTIAQQLNEAQIEAAADAAGFLALPDAWNGWRDHPTQAAYFWSPVRFCILPAGRRSGKTALAKRRAVRFLVGKRAAEGLPIQLGMAAPTFNRAKHIFFRDLIRLVPRHWIKRVNQSLSDMEIVTHWDASIRVFGMDNPTQVEGVQWDRIFIDEFADCPADCFQFHVRPALSTVERLGGADLLGVPDEVGRNQAEYEALYERGLRYDPAILGQPDADPSAPISEAAGPTGEYCSYSWPSADILPETEIRSLRATLDEFAFRQEMLGQFIRSGGKAIPRFDPALHVSDYYTEFAPALPLWWALDFGVNPAVSLIGQEYGDQSWVLDEIVLMDSSTEVMAEAFFERVAAHGWPLRGVALFGDAAGRSPHSNTGASDYEIILDRFRAHGVRVDWNVLERNPAIKDTINAVRGRFLSASGVVHQYVNPRCRRLIDDLKRAPWPHDLREFHCLAALRYYDYARFGMATVEGDYSTGDAIAPGLASTPTTRRA